jgi:hypothetical protein
MFARRAALFAVYRIDDASDKIIVPGLLEIRNYP